MPTVGQEARDFSTSSGSNVTDDYKAEIWGVPFPGRTEGSVNTEKRSILARIDEDW